jgi:UPF0716 protein FxsA
MKRSTIVLLSLVVLAVGEVILLSAAGRAIGVLPLLGVLVGEALLGGWLARREGGKAWASLRSAQQDPAKQGAAITDAALVLVGAFLLILPGFLSDAVGLFFLIPATRGIARRGLTALFGVLTRKYRDQADLLVARATPSTVVEGSVEEADQKPPADDPTIVRGEIEP